MNLGNLRSRIRSMIREARENVVQDEELNNWFNDMSLETTKFLNYPWKEWTLHGVEDQTEYTLPTDYLKLQPLLDVMFDEKKLKKYGVKYLERQYPLYQKANSVIFPTHYYIRLKGQLSLYPPPSLVASGTGTAGSVGTTLVDSGAAFTSDMVGMSVRNETDSDSNGLILTVPDANTLTAVLSGGDNNDFEVGDSYYINRSGTVPYVYSETAMADDDDENEIAAMFPYVLIYAVAPLADMKAYRTDSAAQLTARMNRWDTLYNSELAKAKKIVNEEIRGHIERTISPYDRYSRRTYQD